MKNNTKTVKGLFLLLIAIFVLACSSSPQDRIVGRWEEIPSGTRNDHIQMEFLKDGTVNVYIKGSLEVSFRYIMAADGKSMVFQDPSLPESGSLDILELTSESLVMVAKEGGAWGNTVRMKRL